MQSTILISTLPQTADELIPDAEDADTYSAIHRGERYFFEVRKDVTDTEDILKARVSARLVGSTDFKVSPEVEFKEDRNTFCIFIDKKNLRYHFEPIGHVIIDKAYRNRGLMTFLAVNCILAVKDELNAKPYRHRAGKLSRVDADTVNTPVRSNFYRLLGAKPNENEMGNGNFKVTDVHQLRTKYNENKIHIHQREEFVSLYLNNDQLTQNIATLRTGIHDLQKENNELRSTLAQKTPSGRLNTLIRFVINHLKVILIV